MDLRKCLALYPDFGKLDIQMNCNDIHMEDATHTRIKPDQNKNPPAASHVTGNPAMFVP